MQDLDKFKNEMNLSGKNVYVGHRYVPKIFGEWDNTQIYEPLSIVQYQGASYTSRQYVPVGIEITNEDFWVVTGNYNAQVEQYRQEVRNFKNDINNLNDEVSDARDGELTLNDRLDKDYQEVTTELAKKENYVNYKMFGLDGAPKYYNQVTQRYYLDTDFTQEYTNDDSIQIKQAHEYASEFGLQINNPTGHYVLKKAIDIPITTNVDWGQTVFHIDEKNRPTGNLFEVLGNEKTVIEDQTFLTQIIPYLKKGTKYIKPLSAYRDSLIVIFDNSHKIARNGNMSGDQVWSLEDFIYLDDKGKVIGDIVYDFDNVSRIEIYRSPQSYLNVTGGSFLLTGDLSNNGDLSVIGKDVGIAVSRSRTLLNNIIATYEPGVKDEATIRQRLFGFNKVYDVELRNVQMNTRNLLSSYGISGNSVLNGRFINITGEGDEASTGVIGTNNFKNILVQNCNFNRFDVHLNAYDITIKDSHIGHHGISVSGGGTLYVENTIVERYLFVEVRGDYGANWDGDIIIKDCKQSINNTDSENSILLFHPNVNNNSSDYGFPIVHGREIIIKNFVVDYTGYEENNMDHWLINFRRNIDSTNYLIGGEKITLPTRIDIDDVRTVGREKGSKILRLKQAHLVKGSKEGSYTLSKYDMDITANALYTFRNIDVEKILMEAQSVNTAFHFYSSASNAYESNGLFPKIIFENIDGLTLNIGSSIADVTIKDSIIWQGKFSGGGEGRSNITLFNTRIQPNILTVENNMQAFHWFGNELSLIGCKLGKRLNSQALLPLLSEISNTVTLTNANYSGNNMSIDELNQITTMYGVEIKNNMVKTLASNGVGDTANTVTIGNIPEV